MSRMVFVTGFARGGTTWLRDCIASHPEVEMIPQELVVFRDHEDSRRIEKVVKEAVARHNIKSRWIVEKSPANAPHVDRATQLFPESKFLFIIRDPRDVFISHKRGTREWMGGANSTVEGCMAKTARYYDGFLRARGASNLMLLRYEDLHQDFHAVMERVFEFLQLSVDEKLLEEIYQKNNFWNVATRNIEQRDEARRKGVVGDWALFLEPPEADWFQDSERWSGFMEEYGYDWEHVTYSTVLRAIHEAGVSSVSEEDLLQARLDESRVNLFLSHDIDNLKTSWARDSIVELARYEAELGLASMFFFLPLDDPRYRGASPAELVEFMGHVQRIHRNASLGLHLNAAERFFPKEMDDVGDDHPDMRSAVAYLHEQVDAYERLGVRFRVATAHGYGRRKKRPNNRDSPVFTDELGRRGIRLWDTSIQPQLFGAASHVTRLADVGGALAARGMPVAGRVIEPETYRRFSPGSLIHMLVHPGNFDVRKPLTLGVRRNAYVAGHG